jgi:hypothetical protein
VSVGSGLFDGAPNGIKLYFTQDAYASFVSDYFWGNLGGYMAVLK